jgi:hypothetical protein
MDTKQKLIETIIKSRVVSKTVEQTPIFIKEIIKSNYILVKNSPIVSAPLLITFLKKPVELYVPLRDYSLVVSKIPHSLLLKGGFVGVSILPLGITIYILAEILISNKKNIRKFFGFLTTKEKVENEEKEQKEKEKFDLEMKLKTVLIKFFEIQLENRTKEKAVFLFSLVLSSVLLFFLIVNFTTIEYKDDDTFVYFEQFLAAQKKQYEYPKEGIQKRYLRFDDSFGG